ncbi:thioredoxin family protein [Streptomyces sp. NPDC086554]|uniref:thioredoxin family protein n=1 Tax=Streptomyces sp. NPDC086554 TaxID=3154864 RepID=UPI00341376E6
MTEYIVFTSPTCHSCKRMKPVIIQEAIVADVVIEESDVMDGGDRRRYRFDVASVPTLVAHRDGEHIGRLAGMKSQADLVEFFKATKG